MGWQIVPVSICGTEDRILFGNLKRLRRTPVIIRAGKAFTLPPFPKPTGRRCFKVIPMRSCAGIAVMLPGKNRGYYAENPRLKELLKAV